MTDFEVYTGNCPGNVSKDAKYSVRRRGDKSIVGLTYRAEAGERWHASTESHQRLVEMINAVKMAKNGQEGGPFYINEYRQVIVPAGRDDKYYLAGEYQQDVYFAFEEHVLSGDAKDLKGQPIRPGDPWVGPHPGIPYVLTAKGDDVYYRTQPRPNVQKDVLLSRAVGRELAAAFAERVRAVKGFQGGRFYINEFRQLFAPLATRGELRYVYIGPLQAGEPWFPKPHSPADLPIV